MKKTLLLVWAFSSVAAVTNAQMQPPNASFENWETLNGSIGNTYNEPVDYNTGNECSEIINQLAVTQSNDAYSGSSSARLETLPAFGSIRINGVVTTSNMICSASSGGQEGGYPYTTIIPDSIVGYFKYTPANNDSAYCQLMWLANNDQDTISYTRVNFTEAVTSWTRFSAPVTPPAPGETPEKVSLFFSSSWGDGSLGQAEVGSIFFIDAVEFIFNPQSVNEVYNAAGWFVYPNPANEVVNIRNPHSGSSVMEILDVTGKQVKFVTLNGASNAVATDDLPTGVYLYQVRTQQGQPLKTGKLMIQH